MKKTYNIIYNVVYKHVDFIVTSLLLILTNIPVIFWEIVLVRINIVNELPVRSWSIVFEILFASPYLYLKTFFRKKLNTRKKNKKFRLYIADTSALFVVYVPLYVVKFFVFNKIGWVDETSLKIGIYTTILGSLLLGRVLGYSIDKFGQYGRIKTKRYLNRHKNKKKITPCLTYP